MIENLTRVTKDTRMSFIILQSLKPPEKELICTEIGIWIGENAENMLNIDPTMKLYCVDDYTNIGYTDDLSQGKPEDVKAKAKERLSKFGDRVEFVYKNSEIAYKDFPDEFFDYVYIDGDHSFYGAYRDMKIWWPKVKKGGILAGHDISMPSVSKALIDFLVDIGRMSDGKKIEGSGESDWWIFR